jgi:hypothetical protein
MKLFGGFLLIIVALILAILVSLGVMVFGWGLSVVSWWWVIGVNLIGGLFAHTLLAVGSKLIVNND